MVKGVAASTGIGIGRVVLLTLPRIAMSSRPAQSPEEELRRFDRGADIFCTQLSRLAATTAEHFGQSEAGIITAQIVIMRDPDLREEVAALLEQGGRVEQAVAEVFDKYYRLFAAMDDEMMRARCADFNDMKHRLLRILAGATAEYRHLPPQGSVVVAEEIPPSIAAAILPAGVKAVATSQGHAFSHMAILARCLEIPVVVGAGQLMSRVRDGDELIVDGDSGELILHPTQEQVRRYACRRHHQEEVREKVSLLLKRPSATRDGRPVAVTANLFAPEQLSLLNGTGADGVGFFTTRFLRQEGADMPGEQEQFLAYRAIVRGLRGKPVTLCVLDAPIPANPELFQIQLTAMLRASAFGSLRIVLPKVTSIEELRRARDLLEQCKGRLLRRQVDFDPDIRLGVAIETPAAALIAGTLAQEADFFSIGSDLARYTLADRQNSRLSGLYSAFHPAVLSLIHKTTQAALAAYLPAGIRGEIASDSMMLPFLVGCGMGEITVGPAALPGVREQLGNLSYQYWQGRVQDILALPGPGEVVAYLKDNWAERA